MSLSILNAYAPTQSTKSNAAKVTFYAALNKAKAELDQTPRFKVVTTGYFNATIASHSNECGSWDSILGHNNPDKLETNDKFKLKHS